MQVQKLSMNQLAAQLTAYMEAHGSAQLLVVGHSMVPMLRNGRDRVTLIPAQRSLKAGDVIFFQRNADQLVLHRIIRMDGKCFLCSGDHQHQLEKVHPQQIIAVVSAFERAGKCHRISEPLYRFYARCAVLFFPIRRPFLALRKLAGDLRRRFR